MQGDCGGHWGAMSWVPQPGQVGIGKRGQWIWPGPPCVFRERVGCELKRLGLCFHPHSLLLTKSSPCVKEMSWWVLIFLAKISLVCLWACLSGAVNSWGQAGSTGDGWPSVCLSVVSHLQGPEVQHPCVLSPSQWLTCPYWHLSEKSTRDC